MTTERKETFWMQPAIWVTILIFPLIYYVTYKVMNGVGGEQMQTMVITAVVSGALGTIAGFWLGSSQSSSKKDEQIAAKLNATPPTTNEGDQK